MLGRLMGFDIQLFDVSSGGTASCVEESYFTYNFSNKMFAQYFYIRSIDGQRSNVALNMIQDAFNKMQTDGFTTGIPDVKNDSWGWGIGPDKQLLPKEQAIGVFMFQLQQLCEKLKKWPTSYVVLDFEETATMSDGRVVNAARTDATSLVTYYCHPFKGLYRVDSFKKAMEIYGILASQGNEKAKVWFDLAFRMPDAPKLVPT